MLVFFSAAVLLAPVGQAVRFNTRANSDDASRAVVMGSEDPGGSPIRRKIFEEVDNTLPEPSKRSSVDFSPRKPVMHRKVDATTKKAEPQATTPATILVMQGMTQAFLNQRYYVRHEPELQVAGKETYWSQNRMFVYYCKEFGDWRLAGGSYFNETKNGSCNCYAVSKIAPSGSKTMAGWGEWLASDQKFVLNKDAKMLPKTSCGSYTDPAECDRQGCLWHHNRSKAQCTRIYSVLGNAPNEVMYTDIEQGALGTCYFMAVLASIAYSRPQIIADMFVERQGWNYASPVYTTRWMVTGEPKLVVVDDWFPVRDFGWPWFAGIGRHYNSSATSQDDVIWPMLLEKAWAKMFGSFLAVEAGHGAEAFRAITQAPVNVLIHHSSESNPDIHDTDEDVWDALLEGASKHWPMFSSTHPNVSVELGQLHAFAVLGAEMKTVKGKEERVVKVYNPWGTTQYVGSVPKGDLGEHDGFYILFSEYLEYFGATQVAEIESGYVVSPFVLAKGEQRVVERLEFEMQTDQPFAVQLQWPTIRLVNATGCDGLWPVATVEVVDPTGNYVKERLSKRKSWVGISSVQANMAGGKGKYTVYVYAEFPYGPWVKRVVLNTYAPEKVTFKRMPQPLPTEVTFAGLPQQYLNTRFVLSTKKGDEPHLWSEDGSHYLLFCLKSHWWAIAMESDFESNAGGAKCMSFAHGPAKEFILSPRMGDWSAFNKTKFAKFPNSGVASSSMPTVTPRKSIADAKLEPAEEPSQCRNLIVRLDGLDNEKDIKAQGDDPLFPRALTSIGSVGAALGDDAQGISMRVEQFNHWMSVGEMLSRDAP